MSGWKIGVGIASAVVALIGAGVAYLNKSDSSLVSSDDSSQDKSLKSFVIWGRPDSGKTTFITRLLGNEPTDIKEATDSKKIYKNIPLEYLASGPFFIEEIFDMPGNSDRRTDWLEMVVNKEHVFYLINLSRIGDAAYHAAVKYDIEGTVDALEKSEKQHKRINFIATHLDKSQWKDIDKASVNNEISRDKVIRLFSESRNGVKGCLYSVNLLDKLDFRKLMQDIVNDISN